MTTRFTQATVAVATVVAVAYGGSPASDDAAGVPEIVIAGDVSADLHSVDAAIATGISHTCSKLLSTRRYRSLHAKV